MRMNDYVAFRCAPDLRRAFEAVAGRRGVSHAMRDALAEYIERHATKAKDDKRPAQSRTTTAAAA